MAEERSYAHRPTFAKLGIKPGFRVAVLGAPKGFAASLGAPADVIFTAKETPDADLFLCFAGSVRQLDLASPRFHARSDAARPGSSGPRRHRA